ncbi:SDR family oxidoreductase [Sphingobium baderi]|uniref:Short-chain dehydrogenase n=1 Tax=Sphingobium baderi LL03 TaxID=1114964 RepID=T0HSG6_9SPHN|nr:SDR family NAD(P)-dependent oxidoreductase [Sphingobium baderi]EQB00494.1 hypothetical protein L485_13215 [Sphingobium baderi LL03]KMS61906.1 dehydrogenase [Sphingobium baderi LL03]
MTIAMITGANKGVGFATARGLAQKGVTVWMGARNIVRGAAAEAQLRAEGLDVRLLEIDVTDSASIARSVDRIVADGRGLDILVNNAGIMPETFNEGAERCKPSEVDSDMLHRVFGTNFFGAIEVIRQFLPLLRRSPVPRIVNVSSRLGSMALQTDADWPGRGVNQLGYSSSKAALNMATVIFAYELRDTAIKVNAVSPGIVATDLNGAGADRLIGRPGYGSPEDGAVLVVACATMPDDGPTGAFFGPGGLIGW